MADWALALPALGVGALHGLNTHKQEQKEKEQQAYDRNRQAVIDQQNAESHTQNKQFNNLRIQEAQMGLHENQQKQALNKLMGEIQQFEALGDKKGFVERYINNAHSDKDWDPDQELTYLTNPDTGAIALYKRSKSDGKPQLVDSDFTFQKGYDAIYRKNNGIATYENRQAALAAQAKADRERQDKIDDRNFNFNKDLTLTGIKGQQAQDLALLNSEIQGQRDFNNFQYGLGRDNNNSQNRIAENLYGGTGNKAASHVGTFDLSSMTPQDMLPLIIRQESGGRHYDSNGQLLRSPVGAQGITQVMPKTGVNPGYGVLPLQNNSQEEYVRFGGDYYNAMFNKFGNHELALGAYNAGPGRIEQAIKKAQEADTNNWLQFAPKETQDYVKKITGKARQEFIKQSSNSVANNIQAVSEKVAKEMGDTPVALLKGGFGSTKTNIMKFYNQGSTTAQRKAALNDIQTVVKNTLKNTPAGGTMSEQQLTSYSIEVTANILGSDAATIGNLINAPDKKQKAKVEANSVKGNLSNEQMNPFFSSDDAPQPTKQGNNPLVLRPEYMNANAHQQPTTNQFQVIDPTRNLTDKMIKMSQLGQKQQNNAYVNPQAVSRLIQ